jgi:hypothetical protein
VSRYVLATFVSAELWLVSCLRSNLGICTETYSVHDSRISIIFLKHHSIPKYSPMKTYLNDNDTVLRNTMMFQENDAYPRIMD